jgi:hypothetical protein
MHPESLPTGISRTPQWADFFTFAERWEALKHTSLQFKSPLPGNDLPAINISSDSVVKLKMHFS